MKRFHWLILKSWIGPFTMSFSIILFILVLQFLALYQEDIFGKGLSGWTLFQLFGFAAAKLVIMATPVSILAASLMTFGDMGEHNELAAIKACGIGVFKIARPMIVVACVLTALMLWFSFDLMPTANLKFFSLLYDVQKKKADFALKPGYFYGDIDGYVIRCSGKDPVRGILYGMVIYDYSSRGDRPTMVLADSARSVSVRGGAVLKMILYHGSRHEDVRPEPGEQNTQRYSRVYFDSLYYNLPLKGFDLSKTDEGLFKHQITSPLRRLKHDIDSLREERSKSVLQYEGYLRPYTRIDSSLLTDAPIAQPVTPTNTRELPLDRPRLQQPTAPLLPKQDSLSGLVLKATATTSKQPVTEQYAMLGGVSLVASALNSVRSVKNYTEFMTKREHDEDENLRRYVHEFHKRFSMPMNCIFFMLIGVSLGAIIRKGGLGMPALISIVLLIILYLFDAQGRKLSKEGAIDPVFGAWLTAVVFGPLSVFVTWQATTDAHLWDDNLKYELRDWLKKHIGAPFMRLFSRKAPTNIPV